MMENVTRFKAALAAVLAAMTALWGWFGWLVLAWVGCMAVDYITGYGAAMKNGEWSSNIAREGLWHKGGMIAVVIVAAIADWVMVLIAQYIPIGIQWPGIIMPLVLAWYIITELGSILENAVKMGANVPAWLVKLLKSSANIVENAGGKVTEDDRSEPPD